MLGIVGELAHQLGVVPLLWLGVLHWRGRPHDRAWWLLAGAFGVSWYADTLAHAINPWVPSLVYPMVQAWLVGAVLLLTRAEKVQLLVLLVVALIIATLMQPDVRHPDVGLTTAAFGGAAVIAWNRAEIGRLTLALFIYFAAGLAAWWWFAYAADVALTGVTETTWRGLTLSAWTYLLYQATRAIGIALFCWAAIATGPQLTLSRAR